MIDTKPHIAAFVAAQREMRDPVKDATNPHFRSKFVSLKAVLDAVRGPLHKHGFCVSQQIDYDDSTSGPPCYVRTVLLHESGGEIVSRCPVVCTKPNDPQAMGSAITYARRYALAGICGLAPSDEEESTEEEEEAS